MRAISILLAFSLAAAPGANPMCIAWCNTHASAAADAAGCHRQQMAASGLTMLTTGPHECDKALQPAPFVREYPPRAAAGGAADDGAFTRHLCGRHETIDQALHLPPVMAPAGVVRPAALRI